MYFYNILIPMTSRQLKNLYFNFFRSKGHEIVPSASLIPENDPTVLFTTAGMHPLTPFLKGEKHPQGLRLANAQKCIRTGDIDEVGDGTHLTFFEMLGNWSLGDYFKTDAVEWSFEFLTDKKYLGISLDKLAFTVFDGNEKEGIPRDEETAHLWQLHGVSKDRIAYLDDNFWGPVGDSGPCGPDTEIFYWSANEPAPKIYDPKDSRWIEIWNNVFMAYEKQKDGSYTPLKQKNVDTGMGLERTVAVLDGQDSVYSIDTVEPLITHVNRTAKKAQGNDRAVRIIVDHIRATVFMLADERAIRPSNVDQGYVLRRLIRRMVRYAKMIDLDSKEFDSLVQIVTREYHNDYPELGRNHDVVVEELHKEQEKFSKTIDQGTRTFEKYAKAGTISGEDAFTLFSSYGFPLEMVQELAHEKNISVDVASFTALMKDHQDKSRTASAGKFKGGLADHSDQTVKYHTANHLMLEAMKRILGREDINQRGSNITAERLRFDFTFPRKLEEYEIHKIEEMVNTEIAKGHDVHFEEMSVADAKKIGATGVFEHKYGDKVKVYFVGDFSKEICGGPHVQNTKDMGKLKIQKEEASSAGVRRIKAVLE